MKIIEVIADQGHEDTINGIAEQYAISDIWWGPEIENRHRSVQDPLVMAGDTHIVSGMSKSVY